MKFLGLPDYMDVGDADLQLAQRCDILNKYKCSLCDTVDVHFTMCNLGEHALCSRCITKSQHIPPNPSGDRWCAQCQKFRPLSKINYPADFFSPVKFRCSCGLVGTLSQLCRHLETPEGQRLCSPKK